MARREIEVEHDGHRYRIRQMPAMTSLRCLAVIGRCLGEPIAMLLSDEAALSNALESKVADLAPMIGQTLEALDPNDLEQVVRMSVIGNVTRLGSTSLEIRDLATWEDVMDAHGGVWHMLRVLQSVLTLNYFPTSAEETTPPAAEAE